MGQSGRTFINKYIDKKMMVCNWEMDIAMLQRLSGLARQSGIDSQQRALLTALRPYLSSERVSKLEKAMRAAKLAKLASSVLGSGAIQLPSGR